MAGTPYCRERKLVTSSSVRKPSLTKAEPRRQLLSFCTFVACTNCSVVMTFSLTRRSPNRCDMPVSPICESDENGLRLLREPELPFRGEEVAAYRVDRNCQRNWVTAPVTLVRRRAVCLP